MSKKLACLCLILVCALLLAGCATKTPDYDKGDNAAFVKAVASAISQDQDPLAYLDPVFVLFADTQSAPVFQPHFYILDLQAEADEADPSLVHFTCKVPGLVGCAFNMILGKNYRLNDTYSKQVALAGTVTVETDGEGRRRIALAQGGDPFSLYLGLRYMDASYFDELTSVTLDDGISDDELDEAINLVLTLGNMAYANALGVEPEEYTSTVVKPELNVYLAGFQLIGQTNVNGTIRRMDADAKQQLIGTAVIVGSVIGGIVLFWLLMRISKTARENARDKRHRKRQLLREFRSKCWELKREADKVSKHYQAWLAADSDGKKAEALDALMQSASTLYDAGRKIICDVSESNRRKEQRRMWKKRIGKALLLESYAWERRGGVFYRQLGELTALCQKMRLADGRNFRSDPPGELPAELPKALEAVDHEGDAWALLKQQQKEARMEEERRLTEERRRKEAEEARVKALRDAAVRFQQYSSDFRDAFSQVQADADLLANTLPALFREHDGKPMDTEIERLKALTDPQTSKKVYIALGQPPIETGTPVWNVHRTAMEETAETLCRHTASLCTDDTDGVPWRKALGAQTSEALKHGKGNTPSELVTLALRLTHCEPYDPDRDQAPVLLKTQDARSAEQIEGVFKRYEPLIRDSANRKLLWIVLYTLHPTASKDVQKEMQDYLRAGLERSTAKQEITLAGWAAAALARSLTLQVKISVFDEYQPMLKTMIERYNGQIQRLQEKVKEYNETLEATPPKKRPSSMFDHHPLNVLRNAIDELAGQTMRGVTGYLLDAGMPLFAMYYLLSAQQERHDRFLLQGVIMGFLPWMLKNREALKPQLELLIAKRKEMIGRDEQLSFFEVRVPSGLCAADYAAVLRLVLNVANPSIPYCDTEALLDVAVREVPGVMELLCACPLRLIDPANRRTQGFYQFNPYQHLLWVQYTPPINQGSVHSRYHEVIDMTVPLASGLSLQLFGDPYAVIPTLFHEHQHYLGDRNEASVFLKTQLFSRRFYKAYPDASPQEDAVFSALADLLGMPPSADRTDALNELIEKYYGKAVSPEEAKQKAAASIRDINLRVQFSNSTQTWHAEVKFPLLGIKDGEDADNFRLMTGIIERYACTPRTVTKAEFEEILAETY